MPQKKSSTRNPEPLNIFLIGSPGAGKATQAKFLAKKYGLVDFDMGVEQEKQRKKDKDLDKLFKKVVDTGKMNKSKVYLQMVEAFLDRTHSSRSILFDGHPKKPKEVKSVFSILTKLGRTRRVCVFLEVPWEEAVKRNLKRGGYVKGKKRADDDPEVIEVRYYNAYAQVQLAKEVYKKLYPFAVVDGLGTIAQVAKRVDQAVKKLLKQLDEKGTDKK